MATNRYNNHSNKNAIVRTRRDRNGNLRTETARRDQGMFDVAITTNESNNSTRVFIDSHGRQGNFPYADLELDGRQARTLFIALAKHYSARGFEFHNG